jgi:energy-coupling factor transporter transmembrane protein EcfT
VAVGKNLVMREFMISANNEGQMFITLMEVLKNEAYGVSTMVVPKVLWMVSNIGSIISMTMLFKWRYLPSLLNRSISIHSHQ